MQFFIISPVMFTFPSGSVKLVRFDLRQVCSDRLLVVCGQQVPIFIAGESLGGALSILLGLSLHESNVRDSMRDRHA